MDRAELRRLAGQVLMVGVTEHWSPAAPESLGRFQPGGVILFARNVRDRAQLTALCSQLKQAGAPLVAIDHEGGRVNRLRAVAGVTDFPPARELADVPDADAAVSAMGRQVAEELLGLGIDMALAPVADVLTDERSSSIGNRAYGSDPATAGRLAAAFITAAEAAGLRTCVKHYPGYGAVTVDPHHALARADIDLDTWRTVHLPPFHAAVAAGTAALMTAHVTIPCLDPSETPATLSKPILDRIRTELGFTGPVLTDDLHMRSITDRVDVPTAAVQSLAAGADLLLICHRPDSQLAAWEAMVRAVDTGAVSEARLREAAGRVAGLGLGGRLATGL